MLAGTRFVAHLKQKPRELQTNPGSVGFVVKDGKAVVQPVTISRTSQGNSIVERGLSGGEDIVVDGQLLLSNGSAVEPRTRKAGA